MRPIVRYKGRVIAANRRRGIEKGSYALLDVADFGGVFLHTVKYKADMFAVQFHKFCFLQALPGGRPRRYGIVLRLVQMVSGIRANDFLCPVPVKVSVLYQIVVLQYCP